MKKAWLLKLILKLMLNPKRAAMYGVDVWNYDSAVAFTYLAGMLMVQFLVQHLGMQLQ